MLATLGASYCYLWQQHESEPSLRVNRISNKLFPSRERCLLSDLELQRMEERRRKAFEGAQSKKFYIDIKTQ